MKNKLRHIYHIIFITKRQEMTIPMTTKGMILDQMVQIFTRKGCHVYACNAFLNHVHLLAELNYKRFMFKKLCILLIFSKLNEIKHLIDKYRMHNL
uniref:transposase n=1 Tax=Segatella sp. TaxID=2974253 RepID=UPI003AB3BEDD